MEQNKYYTPEIEDLFIGYECELFIPASKEPMVLGGYYDTWVQMSFTKPWRIHDVQKGESQIRTKYLDKEDIEKCGWILVRQEIKPYGSNWCNFKSKDWELHVQLGDNYFPRLLNINGRKHCPWKGNVKVDCKSINELRKIMKMLGIK